MTEILSHLDDNKDGIVSHTEHKTISKPEMQQTVRKLDELKNKESKDLISQTHAALLESYKDNLDEIKNSFLSIADVIKATDRLKASTADWLTAEQRTIIHRIYLAMRIKSKHESNQTGKEDYFDGKADANLEKWYYDTLRAIANNKDNKWPAFVDWLLNGTPPKKEEPKKEEPKKEEPKKEEPKKEEPKKEEPKKEEPKKEEPNPETPIENPDNPKLKDTTINAKNAATTLWNVGKVEPETGKVTVQIWTQSYNFVKQAKWEFLIVAPVVGNDNLLWTPDAPIKNGSAEWILKIDSKGDIIYTQTADIPATGATLETKVTNGANTVDAKLTLQWAKKDEPTIEEPKEKPVVVTTIEKDLKDKRLQELEAAGKELINKSLNSLSKRTLRKEFRLERRERKDLDKGIKSLADVTQGDPKKYKDALAQMLQAAKDKKIIESWSISGDTLTPAYSQWLMNQQESDLFAAYINEAKDTFDRDFDEAYKRIMGQEVYQIDVSEKQYAENPEVAKSLQLYNAAEKTYSETYKSKQDLEEKIFELMGRKNTLISNIKDLKDTKDTNELKTRESYKNELRTIYIKLDGEDVLWKSLEWLDATNDKIDAATVQSVLKANGMDKWYKLQLDNPDEAAPWLKQKLNKALEDKNKAEIDYKTVVNKDNTDKAAFFNQQSTDNATQVNKNIQEATIKKDELEVERTTVETSKNEKTEEIGVNSQNWSYYQKEDILQKDLDDRDAFAKRQIALEQEIIYIYIRNKVAEQKKIYWEQKVHENADNTNNQEIDRVDKEISSVSEEIASMKLILEKRKQQILDYSASASDVDAEFLVNVSTEIQNLISQTIPALEQKKTELEAQKAKLIIKGKEISWYTDFSTNGLNYLEWQKKLFPLQDTYDRNTKRIWELLPEIKTLSGEKDKNQISLTDTNNKLSTAQLTLKIAVEKWDSSGITSARAEVSSLWSQKRDLESTIAVLSKRLDVANKEKQDIDDWNKQNKPAIDEIKQNIQKVAVALNDWKKQNTAATEYKSNQSTDPSEQPAEENPEEINVDPKIGAEKTKEDSEKKEVAPTTIETTITPD